MDQEATDHPAQLDNLQPTLRAAMAETREQLAVHLHALKQRLLHPLAVRFSPKEPSMATQKKSGRKPAPKKKENAKPAATRGDARLKPATGSKAEKPSKSAGARGTKEKSTGKSRAAREKRTSARERSPRIGSQGRRDPRYDARRSHRWSRDRSREESGSRADRHATLQ